MIRVMYKNGIQDTAGPGYLDYLLDKHKIIKFMRSGGWVAVGRDPTRSADTAKSYEGPEKRASTEERD